MVDKRHIGIIHLPIRHLLKLLKLPDDYKILNCSINTTRDRIELAAEHESLASNDDNVVMIIYSEDDSPLRVQVNLDDLKIDEG
jgi:hypothetical protein